MISFGLVLLGFWMWLLCFLGVVVDQDFLKNLLTKHEISSILFGQRVLALHNLQPGIFTHHMCHEDVPVGAKSGVWWAWREPNIWIRFCCLPVSWGIHCFSFLLRACLAWAMGCLNGPALADSNRGEGGQSCQRCCFGMLCSDSGYFYFQSWFPVTIQDYPSLAG